MYATVDIPTGAPQNLITLPQTAITFSPYGDTVYIVDSKGAGADGKPQLVARQSFVTTGFTRGDQVAVLKGVQVVLDRGFGSDVGEPAHGRGSAA